MMNTDLNEYIAGGYFIAKYADRDRRLNSEDLLPDRLISISLCRGKVLDIFVTGDGSEAYLRDFGIPTEKLASLYQWRTEKRLIEIGYPDVFFTLDAARRFTAELLPTNEDVLLLGIGLHTTLVESFLAANRQTINRFPKYSLVAQSWGLPPGELIGTNRMVSQGKPLQPEGTILGYDLASYDVSFVCSWLCLCHEYDMEEKLGARPNSYGLIDSLKIAQEVQTWRGDDDSYAPWLIVRYPPGEFQV